MPRPRKPRSARTSARARTSSSVAPRPCSPSGRPAPSPSAFAAYLGSIKEYEPIEWIRTGIPAVDLAIGAGIPRGRLIEVIGEPSTTKSAFGYTVIAAFQRAGGQCILIDSEAKGVREFIVRCGVDFDALSYSKGSSFKEVIQIIGRVAQMADPATPALIVWDSIAATPGAEELEFHVSDAEYKGDMAVRARYLSAAFRACCNDLAKKKVTLLAINQLRTKFNFMGAVSMEAPGGKAPKYHAAVRIKMKDVGKIKDDTTGVVKGIKVSFSVIKNSCSPPFREATLRFMFDTGFDIYAGLDELLLRHRRIEKKGGWLSYQGKVFRPGDLERIITEVPDIVSPIHGAVEGSDGASSSSSSGSDSREEIPGSEDEALEG